MLRTRLEWETLIPSGAESGAREEIPGVHGATGRRGEPVEVEEEVEEHSEQRVP